MGCVRRNAQSPGVSNVSTELPTAKSDPRVESLVKRARYEFPSATTRIFDQAELEELARKTLGISERDS